MKNKWTRSPKHIMRKKCVESVIKNWKPSSFIEFGTGTGDMTSMILDIGFYGKCYDLGNENRNIARTNLQRYRNKVEVLDDLKKVKRLTFDYLFAFEVLEHIKNDEETLKQWLSYLKPGGKALLTIPAHMKKYDKEDISVGHIRRYERKELFKLLKKVGCTDIIILNYGFPLGNITRVINNILFLPNKNNHNISFKVRSIKSGVQRDRAVNKLSFLFNDGILLPFIFLQRVFYKMDLGDGYVAYAIKL